MEVETEDGHFLKNRARLVFKAKLFILLNALTFHV